MCVVTTTMMSIWMWVCELHCLTVMVVSFMKVGKIEGIRLYWSATNLDALFLDVFGNRNMCNNLEKECFTC